MKYFYRVISNSGREYVGSVSFEHKGTDAIQIVKEIVIKKVNDQIVFRHPFRRDEGRFQALRIVNYPGGIYDES